MTAAPSRGRGRSRGRWSGAAATFVLLAASLSACGEDPAGPRIVESNEYVAIGDSFTAVAGAGPYVDDVCLRSTNSYPELLVEKLGIASYANVSCGGASSSNLTAAQDVEGRGSNPPQLDAVDPDTSVVTLSLGANDSPVGNALLYGCLLKDGKQPETCSSLLAQPMSVFRSAITQGIQKLSQDVAQISARAPEARIVLVGYPRLLPETGSCPKIVPLGSDAVDLQRRLTQEAAQALSQLASDLGVDLIDMYTASAGHDACSEDPWFNGQGTDGGTALPFHPLPAYHVAVAERLAAVLSDS